MRQANLDGTDLTVGGVGGSRMRHLSISASILGTSISDVTESTSRGASCPSEVDYVLTIRTTMRCISVDLEL